MFNALKYTQELEKAGFSHDQAEASVKLLIDVMNENFATKSDLKETETRLTSAILDTRKEADFKFERLEASIREVEYKMTIKLGTMMTLAIGVTATLMKLLPNFH